MAIQIFKIPVTNIPQTFPISLGGNDYLMTCKWNSADQGGWVLDFADSLNNSIAANLPLISGRNILDGLDYLNFGGQLWIYTDGDDYAVPTLDNLGTDCNLFFVVVI